MLRTQIVNVVATASVGQELDFNELRKCREIFHDSEVYKGRVAYFKTSVMTGKVSIFLSGKMISVGTRSEAQAFKELQIAGDFLSQKGFIKKIKLQPKTHNLVIMADFGKTITLEEFSEKTRAIYEPEQFPGAIMRLEKPFKTSILIFASGKVVITGLKNSEQIEPTIDVLKQLIEPNQ
jgi:transcription initiation factor TFIID TATA-box-binding protein